MSEYSNDSADDAGSLQTSLERLSAQASSYLESSQMQTQWTATDSHKSAGSSSSGEDPSDLVKEYGSASSISSPGFQTPAIKPKTSTPYPNSFSPREHGMMDSKGIYWQVDSYPSWSSTPAIKVPITIEEIGQIFENLRNVFGFQFDSMRNMFDHFMTMLDSRSSRMGPELALVTLHADYIGGENANYRRWYYASQVSVDDELHTWPIAKPAPAKKNRNPALSVKTANALNVLNNGDPKIAPMKSIFDTDVLNEHISTSDIDFKHKSKMNRMTADERVVDIALYLLCWGEANQVRYMPECLAFIYKCARDYYCVEGVEKISLSYTHEGQYLDRTITPLYEFCRDQIYEYVGGTYVHRERDHKDIIGYDDMNQLFWHLEGLHRVQFHDPAAREKKRNNGLTELMSLPPWKRYQHLADVDWGKAFYKTYRETRSWLHMAVNFNRIWIIHLSLFWFYTSFNVPSLYTVNYNAQKKSTPPPQIRWTVVSAGAAFGPIVNMIALFSELMFIPRKWPSAQKIAPRLLVYLTTLIINVAPTAYIFIMCSWDKPDLLGTIVAIVQFSIAVITVLFYSVAPMNWFRQRSSPTYSAYKVFTFSFTKLKGNDAIISYGLWLCIFAAKSVESYFFLTLSLRDPVRELSIFQLETCVGDVFIGAWLCRHQPHIVLGIMMLTDLILFFLDTYLWYIIFNTIFSVTRSFYLGASIWTPWRSVYCRLPKRLFSKIMYTRGQQTAQDGPKTLISQVWNAIIISMYREHLIPLEQVQRLIYLQDRSTETGEKILYEPAFFVSQEDSSIHTSFFKGQLEAERRISFFAQSLATPIPDPVSVEAMPTFTVLVPHYNEKIVLSLREIIKEEGDSKLSLLDYLKRLHTLEWECFVKDSMGIANQGGHKKDTPDTTTPTEKADELPFYCIGFKDSTPEFILRTRLWASLRTQTLYRTISGFMNYPRAIKLLHSVEALENGNPHESLSKTGIEVALDRIARRKFRLIAAIQRLKNFSKEEIPDKEMMLRAYPEMNIAYLDEEVRDRNSEPVYYSALIDGSCDILDNGQRKPKYRIRLSGNPILGDGKSDNQNHALIFHRGEYIQLVDANQDNYLEECLKIRSVLAEFEELDSPEHPYASHGLKKAVNEGPPPPVAILGAREYVFSENIGVLGDVAAGKEQTFGTLFARTLAKIGGKLHYGHPDFLNAIFMTTRGGVSKAQKGLHLNEDIYAGMNALIRGGRIKHCEFNQCGKGRDLGFGSILNFTTKIGAGMGEQMLSREYYYLGTQLPVDRFLSFYYAHPGFHINNMFIVVSLELFVIVALNLAALSKNAIICKYDRNLAANEVQKQTTGCLNLIPVYHWIERCVLSIFVVFFISFLPLFVQELTERGFLRSITRLIKHFLSLSPLFEVFVCQIYAKSLMHDLAIGGAKYISTGRGFATNRIPFTALYARFGKESLYFGAKLLLMLIFVSNTMWSTPLLWFWVTTVALCLAPFIYNPHQFSMTDFFLDYRNYIHWLTKGNRNYRRNSWVAYIKQNRTRITGFKAVKSVGTANMQLFADTKDITRPGFLSILFSEVLGPLFANGTVVIPYLYVNTQRGAKSSSPTYCLLRLGICVIGPIILNFASLVGSMVLSLCLGCTLSRRFKKIPSMVAATMHFVAILNHVIFFQVMLVLQNWSFTNGLLGFTTCSVVQVSLFKFLYSMLLTRELRARDVNTTFWGGNWGALGLGWLILTQPARELLCKSVEMSLFAMDFTLGHFLMFVQTPFLFIPYIDQIHTVMLFWLGPKLGFRSQVVYSSVKKTRHRIVQRYAFIYFATMAWFIGMIIGPHLIPAWIKDYVASLVDSFLPGLVQPEMPSAIRLSKKPD
ncbi:1,3-beta-glucan synthase component Fks1p [Trichomonascus vanleenenianus]|uniref:1,3-beta-glucan synthase component Fks1p n=1 Tax=Trichomonascus vanleenenianus TaxID=2268995 RepID=UPI003ECB4537